MEKWTFKKSDSLGILNLKQLNYKDDYTLSVVGAMGVGQSIMFKDYVLTRTK